MNAVIALCHFCELHGPTVVLSTQVFHETAQLPKGMRENASEIEHKIFYGDPECLGEGEKFHEEDESRCCRACHSLDKSSLVGKDEDGQWIVLENSDDEGLGNAKKRKGGVCYLTNDHERRITYVTRRSPSHPRLRSLLKQACVLSLSCEVSEGREGPVSFSVPAGDGAGCRRGGGSVSGQALSHTFLLKDSHARGFHRWFSIVVVMRDHIYLLNSWPFLVESLSRLIESLQSRAEKVYDQEQAENPQRALRLNAAATAQAVSSAPTRLQSPKKSEVSERAVKNIEESGLHSGNESTHQSSTSSAASSAQHPSASTQVVSGPARSLAELTNDPAVFARLHYWFVWILKAGASRMSEKIVDSLPTKCVAFDFDQHQGVHDRTVKAKEASERSDRLLSCNSLSSSTTLQDGSDAARPMSVHSELSFPNVWDSDDDEEADETFLWPSLDDSDYEDDYLPKSPPLALMQLRSALGGVLFLSLLHVFLTGSQVVLRGAPIKLLFCIARALKFIVPKKCYQPVFNSEEYIPPSKSNLLVLGPHVAVPSLSATSGIYPDLKDMLPPAIVVQSPPSSTPNVFRIDVLPTDAGQGVGDNAAGYWGKYRLVAKRGNISTPSKYPTLVTKIDKAIDNASLGPSALHCHLVSLKEEWMNIADVISRVKRSRRYFSKGTLLGDSGSAAEEEGILLQSLGGQDQDWPLIWFWVYGFGGVGCVT
ncbi:folliculin isoform X2 [Ischnura elegans]|uniref:folliculin isoform X2 n=1 Tax=Ischnura elegans TaxID=197161 RepID=UPI001ED88AA1|nr:folliculin isoform X2 [Ischnura elegans]